MRNEARVLYLGESPVAAPLELLRRVCQPRSQSLPHVTVRYAREVDRGAGFPDLYDSINVDSLFLIGPTSFDLSASTQNVLSTLIFQCESEELEALSYKPDFPDSVFHLTIYDGQPSKFAASVLRVLREYPWHLDLAIGDGRVTPLVASPPPFDGKVRLSPAAEELLDALTKGSVDARRLLNLGDGTRMELVRRLADTIHRRSEAAQLPTGWGSGAKASPRGLPGARHFVQGEFWSVIELAEETGMRPGLTAEQRASGLFITPPELARDMTDVVAGFLEEDRVDFGDPAIGNGIFLGALAASIGPERINTAVGVEFDARRGELTTARWRNLGLKVLTGDFVDAAGVLSNADSVAGSSELSAKRSLILANPPYRRSQRLSATRTASWRKTIEDQTGLSVSPRSDLYVYFVLAAHVWMKPNAIGAWLLPSEFLFTNYGEILRRYLSEKVELLRLHSYDSTLSRFSNARVSSTVVVFRNREPLGTHRVSVTSGGAAARPDRTMLVDVAQLVAADRWTGVMEPPSAGNALSQTVGSLFHVRRGMATGANDAFVIDDDARRDLNIPEEWVKPVLPKVRYLDGDVIESDELGLPVVVPRLWVIDCSAPLGEIDARSPQLADYLREIEIEYGHRTLLRRRKPFYRQEASQPAQFVFSYMARLTAKSGRGRFILNRSTAIGLNNYLTLSPHEFVKEWMQAVPGRDMELLRSLNGVIASEYVQHGRMYVEGLNKLEPRELRELPVSNLPASLLRHMADELS